MSDFFPESPTPQYTVERKIDALTELVKRLYHLVLIQGEAMNAALQALQTQAAATVATDAEAAAFIPTLVAPADIEAVTAQLAAAQAGLKAVLPATPPPA